MKMIKEIILEIQLKVAALMAYKLNSFKEALHYHHTTKAGQQYEGA